MSSNGPRRRCPFRATQPKLLTRKRWSFLRSVHSASVYVTRNRSNPIVDGIDDDEYAYFVHSYGSDVAEHTVASCDYGFDFAAIAANDAGSVTGTQFHAKKQ